MSMDAAESAPFLSDAGHDASRPTDRRYVSKDKQLEKLRSRLSHERRNGTGTCSMVSACKGCRADEVYL